MVQSFPHQFGVGYKPPMALFLTLVREGAFFMQFYILDRSNPML